MLTAAFVLPFGGTSLFGAVIPVTDNNVISGLSPYNWVCNENGISSTVVGASISLSFKRTQQVALQVDTRHMPPVVSARYPIIAWSVNGGALQTHQISAKETVIPLASGVKNPVIDLYIKGMSPFENRYSGDLPGGAIHITGFIVDKGGTASALKLPGKVWLNIGDSIMSGDGAAYAEKQGRPEDDLWAGSDDGRACYGYLLAHHYGYREARIAYGGYAWAGGIAPQPALVTLIDQRTSTVSRLKNGVLSPTPEVVMINLGENGVPAETDVTQALSKLRSRVSRTTKIIVVIPVSGKGRAELTQAFNSYKNLDHDDNAYLVDLGQITFATADGQHPTAAGHQSIYKAALPALDAILTK